jgi:hypothetical protein
MPRPETEITWDGPVADLARALRELRALAGLPTYRKMAVHTHYSASVLADAAHGIRCPTWKVVEAFTRACGEKDDTTWRSLWGMAQKATARRAPSQRRTAPPTPEADTRPRRLPPAQRVTLPPDPWQARTAAGYARQLRALRAWAGKPGVKDIARAGVELGLLHDLGPRVWRGDLLPSSTVYDALNPKRITLPKLQITQMIVHACRADVEAWTAAWRDSACCAFEVENPPLPPTEEDDPPVSRQGPARNMRLISWTGEDRAGAGHGDQGRGRHALRAARGDRCGPASQPAVPARITRATRSADPVGASRRCRSRWPFIVRYRPRPGVGFILHGGQTLPCDRLQELRLAVVVRRTERIEVQDGARFLS